MIELWALSFLLFDLERYLCQVLLFSESTSRCGHTLVDSNNWGPTSCDLLFSILGALGFLLENLLVEHGQQKGWERPLV